MPKQQQQIFDKFTSRLKESLMYACEASVSDGSKQVRTDHLLYGLLSERGSIAFEILKKGGADRGMLQAHLLITETKGESRNLGKAARIFEALTADKNKDESVIFSEEAKKAIAQSVLIATEHGSSFVGTEHLLASLVAAKEGRAFTELERMGVNVTFVRQQVALVMKSSARFSDLTNMFNSGNAGGAPTQERASSLAMFCKDLTDPKVQQSIDPVIGREKEIERIIHILGRRTKNNPILVGDPGVGKTAVVEGLAKKITEGDVPDHLRGKKIVSLDVAQIIAGTIFRGEFEARIKGLIDELEQRPDVILFIDEIHTIVGLGNASGGLDAANMLKPALARPALRCIGTTTHDEFRKHIEKDPALERRFQPVFIAPASIEETLEILAGIREQYEKYHHVRISDEVMRSATELSQRYIQDRALPDKAIDLIDEAAAKIKMQKQDTAYFTKLRAMEQELSKVTAQKEELVQKEEYDKALAMRNTELELQKALRVFQQEYAKQNRKNWPQMNVEDVAAVIAQITKVPVMKLMRKDKSRLLNLETYLKKKIIGQDEAVEAVARFIRRSRSGISSPNRPIGSFIFLGPTGVGKTELAKVLAAEAFENPGSLIRVDMSEFSEKFNISRLIGAPAGYVGYEEGGKLTESVRKKPYSVVLFDEIEKAHPEVFNLLLQMLDDGQLTDAAGRAVNFRNTIIIMTSNTGTEALSSGHGLGFRGDAANASEQESETDEQYREFKNKVLADLKKHFRPEFLNRIDRTVVFRPLTRKALAKIVDLNLDELAERVAKKGIALTASKAAREALVQKGFDPERGARPLRRVIQEMIEDVLAEGLIREDFEEGDAVQVNHDGKKFSLKKA